MAFVIADRVKETTTTAGNGTVTLLGASAGYQSFAAVGNGNTTYYCIAGQTTSEWEVGIGTYTSSGTTLSRDTVLSSSNSGNKVVFSAGTKDVFVTYPSQRAVTTDTTQTLTNKTLSSGSDWNGNAVAVTYGGTGTTTFSNNIIPYFDGSTFNSTNVYFFSNLVGVNISSPGAQLDVQASTGTPLRFATAYADVSAVWGQRIGSSTTEKYRISWDYLNGGFYFYDISNSAERMRIDSSGNVGIGTNAPPQKATVWGGGTLPSTISNCQLLVGDTSGFANAGLALTAASGNAESIFFGSTSSPTLGQIEYDNTNNYLRFLTNSGERMRIDSSGNVGIGTSSPIVKLQIGSSSTSTQAENIDMWGALAGSNGDIGRLRFYNVNAFGNKVVAQVSGARDGNNYGGALLFSTGTQADTTLTERMRIDSSGNVGIRTSSPVSPLTVYQASSGTPSLGSATYYGPVFQNSFGGYGLGININSATGISLIQSQRFDGTATAYNIALNPLGGNVGIGTSSPFSRLSVSNGGSTRTGITISDGNTASLMLFAGASANAVIGIDTQNLVFKTGSTAGQDNGTERMRLSAAGGLSVGTTADPGAGAIYATGNITAYYSDDRLKTRLGKIENALDKVDQLNGFYYEANKTAQELGYAVKREVGVSAQDVQAVLPEIVVPAPIDDKYLTIHYERLVPLLIEAIKELRAEVKALKEK